MEQTAQEYMLAQLKEKFPLIVESVQRNLASMKRHAKKGEWRYVYDHCDDCAITLHNLKHDIVRTLLYEENDKFLH